MSSDDALHGSRYFVWLYSPPESQAFAKALFEIEREVGDSLRPDLDHRVAHLRLEWWQGEVGRLSAGNPLHPLTRALLAAQGGRSPPDLSGLIDTAIWDLASATFGTRAELTGYCERWAGALVQPLAARSGDPIRSFEARPTKREHSGIVNGHVAAGFARELGPALREIELLGDLERDARRGRLRLPLEELDNAGVAPESLAKPPWPERLCALLQARHRAARSALRAAVAGMRREEQPALRGLLVWAALAARHSLRAEQALPRTARANRRAVLADAWLAWRAARRASRGEFQSFQESLN